MKRFITLAVLVALGCASTTTTYPDGRIVEERRIDPDFLSAAIALGQSALQLAALESETPTQPTAPDTPSLVEDMAHLELIAIEVQTIVADGVTTGEWTRLRELYTETQAILRRQGVSVKVKSS